MPGRFFKGQAMDAASLQWALFGATVGILIGAGAMAALDLIVLHNKGAKNGQ